MVERLQQTYSLRAARDLLEAAVWRRIAVARHDAAVQALVGRLARPTASLPARSLAAELGLSKRQLRRRCLAGRLGCGYKTLERILRFQALVSVLFKTAAAGRATMEA